jgi:hypothetical protein
LTTRADVGILSDVKAELLLRERQGLTRTAFVEIVIWRVSEPVCASNHGFKYSLALVTEGVCLLRYDKADFWNDVEAWRAGR